jgi:hypothetical protein
MEPRHSFQASPMTRRHFLRTGALALTGLGVADVLRLRAHAQETGRPADDTAVILLWLPGGPPHMETYDMKPDAPAEYRGDFKSISTNAPGVQVCELLPRHARVADRFTLIRSVAHDFADHGGGHKRFLTGRDPKQPTGFVNDYPMVGSMTAKVREGRNVGLPNYISGVDQGRSDIDVFSFGAAYLGSSYGPFPVIGDPDSPKFEVKNLVMNAALASQRDDRERLLHGFDQLRRETDRSGVMDAMDEYGRKAMQLMTSEKARVAFDLSHEPDALRDRYGRHPWGQRALLARRLVEAGSSWVTMVLENPTPPGVTTPKYSCYNWDSHAVNCHIFDDARYRLPIYDQAVTALVEDLYDRGLDKKVLLIVTGEFGRTPRISYSEGTVTKVKQPGRDHWPSAMSMLVTGGGMRTGQVVGSTDSKGEHPKDRPLTPNDLWATVFRHLGIDTEKTFPDHSGRPMSILPYGEPIRELMGS